MNNYGQNQPHTTSQNVLEEQKDPGVEDLQRAINKKREQVLQKRAEISRLGNLEPAETKLRAECAAMGNRLRAQLTEANPGMGNHVIDASSNSTNVDERGNQQSSSASPAGTATAAASPNGASRFAKLEHPHWRRSVLQAVNAIEAIPEERTKPTRKTLERDKQLLAGAARKLDEREFQNECGCVAGARLLNKLVEFALEATKISYESVTEEAEVDFLDLKASAVLVEHVEEDSILSKYNGAKDDNVNKNSSGGGGYHSPLQDDVEFDPRASSPLRRSTIHGTTVNTADKAAEQGGACSSRGSTSTQQGDHINSDAAHQPSRRGTIHADSLTTTSQHEANSNVQLWRSAQEVGLLGKHAAQLELFFRRKLLARMRKWLRVTRNAHRNLDKKGDEEEQRQLKHEEHLEQKRRELEALISSRNDRLAALAAEAANTSCEETAANPQEQEPTGREAEEAEDSAEEQKDYSELPREQSSPNALSGTTFSQPKNPPQHPTPATLQIESTEVVANFFRTERQYLERVVQQDRRHEQLWEYLVEQRALEQQKNTTTASGNKTRRNSLFSTAAAAAAAVNRSKRMTVAPNKIGGMGTSSGPLSGDQNHASEMNTGASAPNSPGAAGDQEKSSDSPSTMMSKDAATSPVATTPKRRPSNKRTAQQHLEHVHLAATSGAGTSAGLNFAAGSSTASKPATIGLLV
ncbi:unnamed protein product, partial [Amoebophrya sp. A120]|eukprot:GSA120T00002912001.1